MRLVVPVVALLLTGCWEGNGLYSSGDATQPVPAGTYQLIIPDKKAEVAHVSILANGMTQVSEDDGKVEYGFAPLDRGNRRFVAWSEEKGDGPAQRPQIYTLIEKRSDSEFVLYPPRCDGREETVARGAGAALKTGIFNTCHFSTRTSVEKAMRQLRVSGRVIRFVRIGDK
jgi:hypothetical protein